jgi:ribonuclease P/MRP protein subunit POP3
MVLRIFITLNPLYPNCHHRPSVPINLQNAVLAYILQILEGVSEYHDKCFALSRKRKRAAKSLCDASPKDNKKQKLQEQEIATDQDDAIKSPSILRHIVYGINAVTKRLELQSHSLRCPTTVIPTSTVEIQSSRPFKYIFVCRQDVDPAILVDHLPHLVASCNSAQASNDVKLVPLPKGSELVLAQTLGIRRVTVLGIDVSLVKLLNINLCQYFISRLTLPIIIYTLCWSPSPFWPHPGFQTRRLCRHSFLPI